MLEGIGFGFRLLIENTGERANYIPDTFRRSSAMPSMAIVAEILTMLIIFVRACFQPNGEGLARIEPRICNAS